MRRLLGLALIAGLLLPVLGASHAFADPDPTEAQVGVRLVDVPVATADNPRARTYIIDHVRPGRQIERRIEVVNHGTTKQTVSLYPAAARVEKGAFVGEEGRTQNELSSWTALSDPSVTLGPGGRAFVKVTVSIPDSAVRGERYGVVWAEMAPRKDSGGVINIGRVGIRLYVSTGPGGTPSTDFDIVSLTAVRDQSNVPIVQATVRNTGERALDLRGSLTLSDGPAGLSAGPFSIPSGSTLGIGDTQSVQVPLDPQVPAGPWRVKLTLTSGVTTRTAEATLSFPLDPGTGPEVQTSSGLTWWAIPVGSVLGLALIVALAAYLLRSRRGVQ